MVKGIITREAGAVLNKKNRSALKTALDTIKSVLKGAGIDLDAEDQAASDSASAATESATREAAGFSFGDLATILQAALDETREAPANPDAYQMPYRIVDIFDDSFVYCEGWQSTYFRSSYSVTDDGVVTLGTPELVIRKVDYLVPGAAGMQEAGNADTPFDYVFNGDRVQLIESAIAADGTARIKLIDADRWGSSGFYGADVLKRDGPLAFPSGTKMFIDHDTPAEENARPEGTITRLAATLQEDAHFERDPKHGAGLYAMIKVREILRKDLDDIAPAIGTSIRANGKAIMGEAQGKRGPIITSLTPSPLNRVDFVTIPGAGGKILPLFESLRTRASEQPASNQPASEQPASLAANDSISNELGANEMTDDQIREAVTSAVSAAVQPLQDEVTRLREAAVLREAHDVVSAHLRAIAGLPQMTRDRLLPAITATATIKEGALDRAALLAQADAMIRAEADYLTGLGAGRIVNLGESGAPPAASDPAKTAEAAEAELNGIFANWGMSESAAKIAARGRTA